jgi:hypothetical protein
MVAFLLNPGGKRRTRRGKKRSPCSKRLEAWKMRTFGSKSAPRRVIGMVRKYRMKRRGARRVRSVSKSWASALRSERRRSKKAPASSFASALPAAYSRNPRRRRRARFSYNRRRRSRNYSHWIPEYSNPYWVPSYAMNPTFGDLSKPQFWTGTAMNVAPIVLGAVINTISTELWGKVLPASMMTGWKKLVVSTINGALLGVTTSMVLPKYSQAIMYGALTDVGIKAANIYVVPKIQGVLHGLGDYLTPGDAAAARPLGYFGDYLTPGDAAAARPLGQFTMADAAAARPLGYTPNDEVIEGTATHELGMF